MRPSVPVLPGQPSGPSICSPRTTNKAHNSPAVVDADNQNAKGRVNSFLLTRQSDKRRALAQVKQDEENVWFTKKSAADAIMGPLVGVAKWLEDDQKSYMGRNDDSMDTINNTYQNSNSTYVTKSCVRIEIFDDSA